MKRKVGSRDLKVPKCINRENEFELDYLTLAVLKTVVLQSGRMLMDQGGRL